LIITVVGAVIGWLPGGVASAIGAPWTTLFSAIGGISGLVFSLMYRRYIGVLRASKHPINLKARDKSLAKRNAYVERRAYDALRESLRGGNIAVGLYTAWLAKFLGAVDRVMGDTGMADRTLFPHAFGLRTPQPLWTAPAFDRCLSLALIYLIVTIFLIWTVSARVGPAEAILEFPRDLPEWRKVFFVVTLGVSAFAVWRGVLAGRSIRAVVWFIIGIGVVRVGSVVAPVTGFGGGAVIGLFFASVTVAILGVTRNTFTGTHPIIFALAAAFSLAIVFTGIDFGAVVAVGQVISVFGYIIWFGILATRNGFHGVFLLFFSLR
jgi:hypothetical protein